MRKLNAPRMRNIERVPALPPPRIPSAGTNLTAKERKLLKDPEWITEDEADFIMAKRIVRKEGRLARPLREYMRERGIRLRRDRQCEK